MRTGQKPKLKGRLQTFGCRCYPRASGGRKGKLDTSHVRRGTFLGYTDTMQTIVYYDLDSHRIKQSTHARFDEGMNDATEVTPDVEQLRRAQGRPVPQDKREIPPLDFYIANTAYNRVIELKLNIRTEEDFTFGLEIRQCERRYRPYIAGFKRNTVAGRIPGRDKKYRGAFIISIDGKPVHDVETATLALAKAYDDPVQVETSILLCPERKRDRSQRT